MEIPAKEYPKHHTTTKPRGGGDSWEERRGVVIENIVPHIKDQPQASTGGVTRVNQRNPLSTHRRDRDISPHSTDNVTICNDM